MTATTARRRAPAPPRPAPPHGRTPPHMAGPGARAPRLVRRLFEAIRGHALVERGDDATRVVPRRVVSDDQCVRAGLDCQHGGVGDIVPPAHALHLERISDDRAVKCELGAEQVVEHRRSSVAASAFTLMCAVMIDATPAAIAARNGASPVRSARRARAECGSRPSTRHRECFAHAATPSRCIPRTAAATWRATSSGSEPNDRTPMTGFAAR